MASIAVMGAGAMGQFYGSLLVAAGHQVTFYARRDAEHLRRQGLRLRCTATDQVAATLSASELRIPPHAFQVADPDRVVSAQWLLVAVKTTAFPAIIARVAACCDANTRVVVLCNGLGIEEQLAATIAAQRLFGQLCFVCLNRDDDGVIHHLAHGEVSVGHFAADTAQLAELADLWDHAGVSCHRLASLREARWRKLVWNVPFNGLGVRHNRTTDQLLADPITNAEVRRLMAEVIAIANADLGNQQIPSSWADDRIASTRAMGAYAPSTLLDARAGRELEIDALFRAPLHRAQALGIDCPALTALVRGLTGG